MKNKLLKRANGGFSLVELIVVIAIMAILVGVAVPVYSSYIEKSQKAKDQQLVDEVAHALQVYYTANFAEAADDYVVLSPSGADAVVGGIADKAMIATFGENWRDDLSVEFSGWTNDGLLDLVLGMTTEQVGSVAGSTFLTEATTEGMMSTVTNLTGIVSDAIYDSNLTVAFDRLGTLLGPDNSVVTTLNDLEIQPSDPEFSTVVSNLLVGHFASEMANASESPLTELCAIYASAYAYSETEGGDDSLVKELDQYIAGLSYQEIADLGKPVAEGEETTNLEADLAGLSSFEAFLNSDYAGENGPGNNDTEAFLYMMDAVSAIAGTYTDKETLADAGMYSSSSVADQVDNYANAVRVVASGIDQSKLTGLEAGSVVVFITADGVISVIPSAVFSK